MNKFPKTDTENNNMSTQIFDTAHQKVFISHLAIAVIVDTHQRVGGKLKHCLCTLLGCINDDGSVQITDAYANHVIVSLEGEASGGAAFPEKTHHDLMVQTRLKVYARETVLGWGTTDLDGQQLQALSDWARQDSRGSRFTSQKRLSSPLLILVDPPTANSDLSIRCFMKGPIGDCLLRPLPIFFMNPSVQPGGLTLDSFQDETSGGFPSAAIANRKIATQSENSETQELLTTLIKRVSRCLEIARNGVAGKESAALGRELYQVVTPPMPSDLDTVMVAHKEDYLLFDYMSSLSKLQFELAGKLHLMYA